MSRKWLACIITYTSKSQVTCIDIFCCIYSCIFMSQSCIKMRLRGSWVGDTSLSTLPYLQREITAINITGSETSWKLMSVLLSWFKIPLLNPKCFVLCYKEYYKYCSYSLKMFVIWLSQKHNWVNSSICMLFPREKCYIWIKTTELLKDVDVPVLLFIRMGSIIQWRITNWESEYPESSLWLILANYAALKGTQGQCSEIMNLLELLLQLQVPVT